MYTVNIEMRVLKMRFVKILLQTTMIRLICRFLNVYIFIFIIQSEATVFTVFSYSCINLMGKMIKHCDPPCSKFSIILVMKH